MYFQISAIRIKVCILLNVKKHSSDLPAQHTSSVNADMR